MIRVTFLILAAQVLMVCGIVPEHLNWWLVAGAFWALIAAIVRVVRLFPAAKEGCSPATRRLGYHVLSQLQFGDKPNKNKTTFMFKKVL